MYAKRNLPTQVVAEEKVMFVGDKYILKKQTKWNYQIQGLMGITGIHCCDLVTYTFKGSSIVVGGTSPFSVLDFVLVILCW